VRAFGAKGDGAALDTVSIQKAIDACQAGAGGKVYFPQAPTGPEPLLLKAMSASVWKRAPGSSAAATLGLPQAPRRRVLPRNSSAWVLLHGVGVENVTLEGKGTIDGANAGFTNSVTGQCSGALGVLFERSKSISLLDLTVTRFQPGPSPSSTATT